MTRLPMIEERVVEYKELLIYKDNPTIFFISPCWTELRVTQIMKFFLVGQTILLGSDAPQRKSTFLIKSVYLYFE